MWPFGRPTIRSISGATSTCAAITSSEKCGANISSVSNTVLAEIVLLLRPVAVFQRVRSMAAEQVHHMLARRRQCRIDDGRTDRRHERPRRVPAMLGIVIGPLQPVDVGRDMHVGRIVEIAENAIRPDLVEELPLRRPFAGDVQLECGREGPVGLDLAHHLGRQLLLAHEVEIEMLGIGVGGDHRRAINRPVGGDDTAGPAVRTSRSCVTGAVGEDVDAMASRP